MPKNKHKLIFAKFSIVKSNMFSRLFKKNSVNNLSGVAAGE